jgi:predicted phage tail protein
LDVLKDICAAGRASPSQIDGKWTVIIDEAKTQVIQHFSTHNSWGFESQKALIKIPDAFKVVYYNEYSNYVQDEIYVYNKGKDSSNAVLFEQIQLPGVTNSAAAYKHARWHLAQLRLRPETYTLNTDLEYLVCNRGDLVRVQHDVPMWGVGTARIKEYISSTELLLDNSIPLTTTNTYAIRIRLATGDSVYKLLLPVATDGYYNTIHTSTPLTELEGAPDNLILLGLSNSESQECLVISIEPSNGTAKLTLVDYNPDIYNIDSSNEYPLPDFTTNITQFPDSFIPTMSQYPTITNVISDESALEVLQVGVFRVRIKVSYSETVNQKFLQPSVTDVELQWKYSNDTSNTWSNSSKSSITNNTCYAIDVKENESYDLRIRYLRYDGISGPWSQVTKHTVVGKTTPPSSVTGLETSISGTEIKLSWNGNSEIDLSGYEVRLVDSGWGDTDYIFKGSVTECYVAPPSVNNTGTWFLKAYDT